MIDDSSSATPAFQSAPLVAEGRCPDQRAEMRWRSGFNPRPSLPRGDAWYWLLPGQLFAWFQSAPLVAEGRCTVTGSLPPVEIAFQSAPLVAEGRCQIATIAPEPDCCFNPRPSLPRGDARRHCTRDSTRLFQSAPLVAEGRCILAAVCGQLVLEVSIRAPRCRGAMRSQSCALRGLQQVSIRAPRCRGAMPASRCL